MFTYNFQAGDFCINPDDRIGARVMVSTPYDVIISLNQKMNNSQKELFRLTSFGHFLNVNEIYLQHQLIHKMLLMEVRQPNKEQMWFSISGRILKFSIEEFCIVTGLKCNGLDAIPKSRNTKSMLRQIYFGDLKSVYNKDVEQIFMNMPSDSRDEDVVKSGILYLITPYLFTAPYKKQIALTKSTYDEGIKKDIFMYRLYGFSLAFQIWIYEVVPSIDGKICSRLHQTWPRLLNWTNTSMRVMVEKINFDLPDASFVHSYPNDSTRGIPDVVHIADAQSHVRNIDKDDDVNMCNPLQDPFYTEVVMK
ncbi:DUF1985 domain-containing protein [Abeliophyllum distichum]|uniref:DUF1985 domain-containing protein n=1 Tax=Abeliophyllum distichum TaxID=126358 RepID=A0ABD1NR21_9LAMI